MRVRRVDSGTVPGTARERATILLAERVNRHP